MPSFRTATIAGVLVSRRGLQRVVLDDGANAYVLTDLIGPVSVGDRVVVNTTAVDLGLGTGGSHVVHWNLARDERSARSGVTARRPPLPRPSPHSTPIWRSSAWGPGWSAWGTRWRRRRWRWRRCSTRWRTWAADPSPRCGTPTPTPATGTEA